MFPNLRKFLEYSLIEWSNYNITVGKVVVAIVLWLLTKFVLYLIKKIIHRREKKDILDEGKGYAIYQITSYLVYIIAILLTLDFLGFHITVILASSTALLVGLGLGLQDTFKDWVAGIVLLIERAITAGDIIEVDDIVGIVEEVGLRTTIVKTRDDIVLVIPNQKLTSNYVINWTQNGKSTRFSVNVGVAYGTDTHLVKSLLIESAKEHMQINNKPQPSVFFEDFGNSSLDFKLLFFSNELFRIERIKSDLRFSIDKKFRENNITIPFPQRDLWIKNAVQIDSNSGDK